MDSKLALCRRRNILVSRVLTRPLSRSRQSAWPLYHYEMASLLRRRSYRAARPATVPASAGQHLKESDTRLHPEDRSLRRHHWLSMRPDTALPVLYIYRLVHAISSLAEWSSSGADLCYLVGTGVGVERLSQYQNELDGGCRLSHTHRREYMARR